MSQTRLQAILWFVAAALAFAAVGLGVMSGRVPNWGTGAAGLFFLAMGWSNWQRSQSAPTEP
jgi:hypothetical protein